MSTNIAYSELQSCPRFPDVSGSEWNSDDFAFAVEWPTSIESIHLVDQVFDRIDLGRHGRRYIAVPQKTIQGQPTFFNSELKLCEVDMAKLGDLNVPYLAELVFHVQCLAVCDWIQPESDNKPIEEIANEIEKKYRKKYGEDRKEHFGPDGVLELLPELYHRETEQGMNRKIFTLQPWIILELAACEDTLGVLASSQSKTR
ncbi:hypothetical protein PG988_006525 [Apiospora saccharicola]